jgi:hypothetical protein
MFVHWPVDVPHQKARNVPLFIPATSCANAGCAVVFVQQLADVPAELRALQAI